MAPTPSAFETANWRFARHDTRELQSADGQRTYCIRIGLPDVPAPAAGYPAIVMLDGHLVAPLFDAMLPQVDEPILVVLIGHAPMGEGAREARAFDYTPPIASRETLTDPRNANWRNGGADAFLALLNDRIVPDLIARYPVDPARLALYGHSYGALCVAHALQSQAAPCFNRYVIVSPSVWWHDGAIHAINSATASTEAVATAKAATATTATTATTAAATTTASPGATRGLDDVLVMAGTDEQWHAAPVGPDGSPASRTGGIPTLPGAREFARGLAARPGVAVMCRAIPGGTHHSMLAQSIAPALDFARRGQTALAAQPDTDLLETPS